MDGTAASSASVASVVWCVGQKIRATVIMKVAFSYTLEGELLRLRAPHIHRADQLSKDELSVVALCELAPFVRSPEVIVVGKAHGDGEVISAGLRVERDGALVIDKTLEVPRGADVAGLGPVGRAWPFEASALALSFVTLPPALDGACFQRAAGDQAVGQLRGGEHIALQNLHAGHPHVAFEVRLPAVQAQVIMAGKPAVVPLIADAYLIDCEQRQLHVLWRGSVPVEHSAALADAMIETWVEGTGDPDATSQEEAVPSTVAFAETTGARTAPMGVGAIPGATLPFVGGHTQEAPATARPIEGAPWSPVEAKPVPAAAGVQRTLSVDELRALEVTEDDTAPLAPATQPAPTPPPALPLASVARPASASPAAPTPATPSPQPARWRDDPPAPAAPAVNASTPAPRRDIRADLYGKLKRR